MEDGGMRWRWGDGGEGDIGDRRFRRKMEGRQEMEETAFWETEKMMEVLVPGE